MAYIYIELFNRFDAVKKRKCLKPDDLDSRGRKCGKRAKGVSIPEPAKEVKHQSSKKGSRTKGSSASTKPSNQGDKIDMPNLSKGRNDDPLATPKGRVVRVPVKFAKGKPSGFSLEQIEDIAQVLKHNGRNTTPVFVKRKNDEDIEVIGNNQIWEAAKKAKLDFMWTIELDDEMEKQMAIEMGQARLRR